ncbi:Jerky protein [Plakobranchus ocellatus]|uniref:Jerky protein n=1 Tax=Plakobranchus ocellatus TaxID=259542 RepID=A0AAV4BRZ3_9GAST|nr:Jerky protein [Plakobranchus ocellatus]
MAWTYVLWIHGERLPPLVIFPGKRWTFRPEEDFPGAVCKQSDNGWVKSEVFWSWLLETFVPHVQDLPRPVVLFCDGHTSHVVWRCMTYARQMGLCTFCYLPMPRMSCNLLTRFIMATLREWKAALNWHRIINKVASIFPRTFMPVFRNTWQGWYYEDHFITAFHKSGLSPWNPDAPDHSKCSAIYIYGKARPQCKEQPGTFAAEDPPVKDTLGSTPSKPDDQPNMELDVSSVLPLAPLDNFYECLPPSFDSLPLPDGWTKKLTNVVRKQPPKYISGNSYKAFEEDKVRAAEAKKQEAEERKQELIRKKADKEEEKKRKDEQQRQQSTRTKQRNLKRKAGETKMEKVGVKRSRSS